MSPVVELLQTLIRIPSVNPEGSPGCPHTGEQAMADFVAQWMAARGAHTWQEEVLPGRPNVFARFGAGKRPRLLLAPHTDTVGIEGMTVDPFGGEIRDGRLYGRGASDTKGTLAAMMMALAEIGAERLEALGCEITLAGLMAEETGQHGSRHLAATHEPFDFALIGEPTECDIVHTHKGCSWIVLETKGVACHGSTPERGQSAIAAMTPVVVPLLTDFVQHLTEGPFSHPVLGTPTLNIGQIRGGTRTNIVPDHCEIHLDLRETPALRAAGAIDILRAWLDAHGFTGVRIASVASAPPLDTPVEHPAIQQLIALGAKPVGAPWLCDAAWLAEKGTPAVAAGPGSIAQAHTRDEFLSLADLEAGVVFYRRFIEGYGA
jgi:acetylornithine deacetylase/succinyl-diaminopimelate desuccinylase-like protein